MNSALHQLGSFIVYFQHVEGAVNELIELLSEVDTGVVQIMTNALGYAERVRTAEALFIREEALRGVENGDDERQFRKLCVDLLTLGSRRNHFVHSRWFHWTDVHGQQGLLRRRQRLKQGEAFLHDKEEELHAEDFEKDLLNLTSALRELDRFRLQLINRRYPDVGLD